MKKYGIFTSKKEMITSIILFCLLLCGFIYFGNKDDNINKTPDNEKFYEEHKEVSGDNVFQYLNVSDAYTYVKQNDVLILFIIKCNIISYLFYFTF